MSRSRPLFAEVRRLSPKVRVCAGLLLAIVVAAAVTVFIAGGNPVGATRYVTVALQGRCSLRMRVPVSLQLARAGGYPGTLNVTGDGLPSRVFGRCLTGGKASRIAAVEAEPGSPQKLTNGAYVAVLREHGGGVTYVVPLAGGALGFGQSGDSVNAALVYLIEHTRGRILPCSAAATGCAVKITGSPDVLALKPPSGLSVSERATFLAGETVAGESGCEGCHQIGGSGNNGPGPPLTHIGKVLRPAAIAAAIRNPTAPMPSFAGLAETSPKKFRELVQFLAMLR